MRTRAELIFVLGALACACGGKLAGSGDGSDGNGVGTGSSGVASCGGDAGPFLGTWTCELTSTPTGPSVPGAVQGPASFSMPITFAESQDGGLSMTIGAPDAGEAPSCTLNMTAADNAATVAGQQSCWDESDSYNDQYSSGTFSVSGCGASLTDLVVTGRIYTTQWYATEGKTSGTCTKD